MSIPTGEVAGEDLFAQATAAADDLYNFRDNCFRLTSEERDSKLQSQSDLALQILDKIPIGKLSVLFKLTSAEVVGIASNLD